MLIAGYLDDKRRAVVRLNVRGATNDWQAMTFEVDTGAEPDVVTSLAWIKHFDAAWEAGDVLTMANGRKIAAIRSYLEVEWFGTIRIVEVSALADSDTAFLSPGRKGRNTNALLGRRLLAASCLTIDYGRGRVSIVPSEVAPA
jgi:hypothetical protein